MARPPRPLTGTERTEACPRCGARPGRRCTNPNGKTYQSGHHAVRAETAPGGKFSTEKVHPETLARVGVGTGVIVRDAHGEYLERIAQTGVVRGHDFLVIWVARPEAVDASRRPLAKADALPWPAEDVWLPGDEPREEEADGTA